MTAREIAAQGGQTTDPGLLRYSVPYHQSRGLAAVGFRNSMVDLIDRSEMTP